MPLKNETYRHDEITTRIKSGKPCDVFIELFLYSWLFSRILKETTLKSVVLMGRGHYFNLKKEFLMLSRIFGPTEDEVT